MDNNWNDVSPKEVKIPQQNQPQNDVFQQGVSAVERDTSNIMPEVKVDAWVAAVAVWNQQMLELTPELEKLFAQYLKKTHPSLYEGVTIFDFMKSTEMKLYRAALIFVPFSLVIDFQRGPINLAIMLGLYVISGWLFNAINRRKSSVLLYWLTWKTTIIGKILFVLMTLVILYMTWTVAGWYRASVEAVNWFFEMIWANLQTLNNITEKAGAFKDTVVDTASSVGNTIVDTASWVGSAVWDFFD